MDQPNQVHDFWKTKLKKARGLRQMLCGLISFRVFLIHLWGVIGAKRADYYRGRTDSMILKGRFRLEKLKLCSLHWIRNRRMTVLFQTYPSHLATTAHWNKKITTTYRVFKNPCSMLISYDTWYMVHNTWYFDNSWSDNLYLKKDSQNSKD